MDKDKQRLLTQLLGFVKEQYDHPDNKEFAAGIQSLVINDIRKEERGKWSEQISEIYELCLMKNLREQAEDLYKVFPLTGIADKLVGYYVEMENARRRNDFDSFGLNLYLQVELIAETIIRDETFIKAYDGIRKLKPLTRYDMDKQSYVRINDKRKDSEGNDVFIDTVDKYLIYKSENYGKPLVSLYAMDKVKIVIYMVCFLAKVEKFPRNAAYSECMDTLFALYNVRCHDSHSGVNVTPEQEAKYERLHEDKTMNYLRFLGFLLSFIKGVSQNFPLPDSILSLAGMAK